MARTSDAQLNVRSTPAKLRATELALATGKTVAQVVEEAVLAYRPEPPADEVLPEGLIRKGKLLVFKGHGGRKITLADTNRMIDEGRNRDLWGENEED